MMLDKIRDFLEEDREFFRSGQNEITVQNNRTLIDGCVIYALVLTFYTLITSFTNQPELLRKMYYCFDIVHAGLCVCVLKRSPKRKKSHKATQRYCALLEISVLGFFVLEAVFALPTQHSLYIPIAILLILLLYVHRVLYTSLLTLLYVSSYAVLSCLYKTPEAAANDVSIAIATGIAAVIGYILIAQMRHNENAALRKYKSLSKTDTLTGLYNKSAIETVCKQILSQPNHSCAMIILDLDSFKKVNDIYGHDVGDEVLSLVGQTLRVSFREIDSIGRFGGDEFIVLMDNCKEPQTVVERVEKIIERISKLRFSPPDLRVQCSAGIALNRTDDAFQTVFKRADQALYEAKSCEGQKYRLAD